MHFNVMMCAMLGTFLAFSSCKTDDNYSPREEHVSSDFSVGRDGWTAGFAEYNGDQEPSYELNEGLHLLPPPLDVSKQAFLLSGMNRSDDLFMYLKRKVSGLAPNTSYKMDFTIVLASDAMSGGVGAGGAPGEAVGIGVGASAVEPTATADENNFYQMNIDKINQCCTDGEDMIVIGDIANGTDAYAYTLIERAGSFMATTNADGDLWLIVGTDSGYEGRTSLYYTKIDVKLRPNS